MTIPKTPYLAVDIALFNDSGALLLIARKNPPYGLALPGGFVDIGEDPLAAARRELREETGIECGVLHFFGYFGDPARDPRGHVVSLAFGGRVDGCPAVVAADDAVCAEWIRDWKTRVLAFDHGQIAALACAYVR